jgi:hypothetical protein
MGDAPSVSIKEGPQTAPHDAAVLLLMLRRISVPVVVAILHGFRFQPVTNSPCHLDR